ncbi:MAG: type II toxin-antitoxin system RelE/ParE family toxin [Candidatus Peribacteraceae bacterium]|jgi:mRNA-degrading endonuclease RelE of RelBE toxin-antitoxin system|nr:type II toxin-antitoxin system RelE/ParE family toxin [Candidatus Peribacteraceae bacterium]
MDRIEKIIRALSTTEREAMLLLMEQLRRDYRKVPGLKALRGMKGWFRVRVGDYRIIFTVDPTSGKAEIRRVTRRNEETYKRLG